MSIPDGLYILTDRSVAPQISLLGAGTGGTVNPPANTARFDPGQLNTSLFQITNLPNGNIKISHSDSGTSLGDNGLTESVLQIGNAATDPKLQWQVVQITAVPPSFNLRNAATGNNLTALNFPPPPFTTSGPWEIYRIGADFGGGGGGGTVDGKSASEWRDIARRIFQEGYKLAQLSSEPFWASQDDSYKQSYVDLFLKLGQDNQVYP